MKLKLGIQIGMGSLAFVIWSSMAYFDPSLRGDYVKFIVSVVIGISALALRDMPTNSDKPAEPKEPIA
jgi:hypothetical protein